MHSVVNVPNGYVVWLHSTTQTHTQANTLRKTPQTLTHTHTKLIALFCYTELQLPVYTQFNPAGCWKLWMEFKQKQNSYDVFDCILTATPDSHQTDVILRMEWRSEREKSNSRCNALNTHRSLVSRYVYQYCFLFTYVQKHYGCSVPSGFKSKETNRSEQPPCRIRKYMEIRNARRANNKHNIRWLWASVCWKAVWIKKWPHFVETNQRETETE